MIEQLVPEQRQVGLESLVASLEQQQEVTLDPFGAAPRAFAAALAEALLHDPTAARHPELVALAYWMRPAEIARMKAAFEAIQGPTLLLAPRGLALHFAPGNVDTIFLYSWLLALLCGNRNVIRVSRVDTPVMSLLTGHVRQILQRQEHEAVRRTTWILRFEHDDVISRALSALADVRVIWGGDATVTHLRGLPLPPHAREITFPDRFAFAALSTTVASLSAEALQRLAEGFFNDAYLFDQMACASPRLVVWLGAEEEALRASERFFDQLAKVIEGKRYRVPTAVALAKLTFGYSAAAARPLRRVRRLSNELLVMDLDSLANLDRTHCGGGAFFQARVDSLSDLVPFVCRKDQCVTVFGFSPDELRAFARQLAGRGVNHIVPVGQALAFHRFWDGADLLQEMCQRVYLPVGPT
jgi:Acyl-CoA reductase (LuxC)